MCVSTSMRSVCSFMSYRACYVVIGKRESLVVFILFLQRPKETR